MTLPLIDSVAGLFKPSPMGARFRIGPENIGAVQERIDDIRAVDLEGLRLPSPSQFQIVDKELGIIQVSVPQSLNGLDRSEWMLPMRALTKAFGPPLPEPLTAYDAYTFLERRSGIYPDIRDEFGRQPFEFLIALFSGFKAMGAVFKTRVSSCRKIDQASSYDQPRFVGFKLDLQFLATFSNEHVSLDVSLDAHCMKVRSSTDQTVENVLGPHGYFGTNYNEFKYRLTVNLLQPEHRNTIEGHQILVAGLRTLLEPLLAYQGPVLLSQFPRGSLKLTVQKDHPVPEELPDLRFKIRKTGEGIFEHKELVHEISLDQLEQAASRYPEGVVV